MLPTPYYQDHACTIYHGDCREILPLLPKVDLVLTDPPYGIQRDGMKASTSKHGGRKPYKFMGWDGATPDPALFAMLFESSRDQIFWGGNYFPQVLPPRMGWLYWDKGQKICSSDGELAFTSFNTALRSITLNRVELLLEGAQHPTQKPLKLMTWCIEHAEKHGHVSTILDPFMGSGTTLRAAKDLGRKAIGIEINKDYCDIAVERLRQEVLGIG